MQREKNKNVFHCSDLPSLFSILGITDFSDFLFIHLDMDIFFLKENYFIVFIQNIFLYYKRYCKQYRRVKAERIIDFSGKAALRIDK